MSKLVRLSALAGGVLALGALAPVPAQAAPGPARYRAEVTCWHGDRWGKVYVKTDARPTRVGQLANVVEWGYAIKRTTGNHRNSSIYTYSAKNLAGRWYHSGGPGYVNRDAIEDNRWHRGPMINPRPVGYPYNGELAISFEFTFDRNGRTTCGKRFGASALKPI